MGIVSQHQLSREYLLEEIASLRQELAAVKQDKRDLEIVLENTTAHADLIEAQLQSAKHALELESAQRLRAASALKSLVTMMSQDVADLTILLENTTEHGDAIESLLQQQAEDATRNSEKQLVQFLDAMPVGVTILDPRGRPSYLNAKARKLLGKGIVEGIAAEQLSEAYQIYLAGSDRLYPTEKLPGVRALKGESSATDDLEIRQGGRIIPIETWATPIFDDRGRVISAAIAFQDITERKKAETERSQLTSELLQLNQAYSRFVPRQFLELLDKESIIDVDIGDYVRKDLSVLFADIRHFTALSERMTPEDNFKFINAYLGRMEPAIIENSGFIDKYIGDGIMALFNGSADDALNAAIAMLKILAEYNTTRQRPDRPPIEIGIGINTGSLMLGTVGGRNRMDSTAISDAVNLASRLEGLTRNYGVPLLISHQTFLYLQNANHYAIRIVDRVKVKGRSAPIAVYEAFDADPAPLREGKLATKSFFEQALLHYNLGEIAAASQLLQDCLQKNPEDSVARIYLQRCRALD